MNARQMNQLRMNRISRACGLWILFAFCIAGGPLTGLAAEPEKPLLPLNSVQGVLPTFSTNTPRMLEVVTGAGNSTDGNGAIKFGGVSKDASGNHYFGIMVPLPAPLNLDQLRIVFDVRCDTPETLRSLYVRCYNRGENKPAWSFNGQPFARAEATKPGGWLTLALQREVGTQGLQWEPSMVEQRQAAAVDRIEFIVGTPVRQAAVAASIDNLRTAPAMARIADLAAPKKLIPDTVLVRDGRASAIVLHPDSQAGREAAAVVVQAIRQRAGVALEARPGTAADREPAQTAILLGNLDTNPALLLLYAR